MNSAAPASEFPGAFLDERGLNRQAVFDLAALPERITASLGDTCGYRQLILIGHAGRKLWTCVQAAGIGGEHPIDTFSRQSLEGFFAQYQPDRRFTIIFPGETPVGLQALGALAGWHHPSPFRIGVDAEYGSWFAYRVAALADTHFVPSVPVDRGNPCLNCAGQPCIAACPAGIAADGHIAISDCIEVRLQPESPCALNCLARQACPVGAEHRYDMAQIRHSASRSLRTIQGR